MTEFLRDLGNLSTAVGAVPLYTVTAPGGAFGGWDQMRDAYGYGAQNDSRRSLANRDRLLRLCGRLEARARIIDPSAEPQHRNVTHSPQGEE